ncbi:MAG TPA: hypothetical protein P5179_01480 [Candidatus Latescibacteria bacterium]|nr:hypothetical protein [Candidatus Latescibacterota bacterium]HRS93926.1 hypothetical protein [Candidatus Latescibacterota bacterium]
MPQTTEGGLRKGKRHIKTTPPGSDVEDAGFSAGLLKQGPGKPLWILSPLKGPMRTAAKW